MFKYKIQGGMGINTYVPISFLNLKAMNLRQCIQSIVVYSLF